MMMMMMMVIMHGNDDDDFDAIIRDKRQLILNK